MAYLKEILYLLGDKRRALPWLIGLFLASSMLDLLGLGLIAPYILLILEPSSFYDSYIGEVYGMIFSSVSENKLISMMSLVLLGVFIFKAVSAIYINRVIIIFGLNLQAELKSLLMRAYSNLDYTEFLNRNSSEYIQAIINFTAQFTGRVLQSLLRMTSEGISGVVIVILLAVTNGPALGLLLILLGGVVFVYDRIFKHRVKEYGQQSNIQHTRTVKGLQEAIEGFKEIRILGKEEYFRNIVVESANQYSLYNIKSQVITTAPRYLLELILILFIVLLVIGTMLAGLEKETLLPTLSLFGIAAMRLVPSANTIVNGLSQMRFGRNATSNLYKELKKIEHDQNPLITTNIEQQSHEIFQTLELNQICYQYPGMSKNSLDNLTLIINKGESIGLIGASGSGKTTLVNTMLGLLKPHAGNILFNNNPISNKLTEWRANVAYIPQNILILDSTLRCNVALGIAENEIDDQKLHDALQQARLTDLAGQLPEGVETLLGEHGIRLSGGQRQRVALARAFYHDRNVLVMDEATSALDNETEQEIIEEIKRLKGRKTTIVIAHRLTTVQHCDRIYRLENGMIIEQGTYESVITRQSNVVN